MNWRTTGALFVVAVILAGAVYLQVQQEESAVATPTVSASLPNGSSSIIGASAPDSIVRMDITLASGLETSFDRQDDGIWHMTVPTATTVISQTVANAVSGLINAGVQRTFTPEDTPLEAYGLLEPMPQVVLAESRGGQTIRHLLQIGHEAPTGNAYYVLKDGDRRVHLISKSALDTILALATNPPLPEAATTPSAPPSDDVATPASP